VNGAAVEPLVALLRKLADAPTLPNGAIQAHAFDFRGRLTKLVVPREVVVPTGTEGQALLQRRLAADLVRSAGLQVVLPEATCRRLPLDLQAALRRRFGLAGRSEVATSRTLPTPPRGAPSGTTDVPRLALEALCRWIQEHAEHFAGHPASMASAPVYVVYRHGDLIAISVKHATRLLARFTQGTNPKALWEAWRARGWLRHDPDRFTIRRWEGTRQRRWLALTWAAWVQATGDQAGPRRKGAAMRPIPPKAAVQRRKLSVTVDESLLPDVDELGRF
jgi:hypothetical protein